jgi:hypothetical protein
MTYSRTAGFKTCQQQACVTHQTILARFFPCKNLKTTTSGERSRPTLDERESKFIRHSLARQGTSHTIFLPLPTLSHLVPKFHIRHKVFPHRRIISNVCPILQCPFTHITQNASDTIRRYPRTHFRFLIII